MTQDTTHMPLDERGLAPCPFCGGDAKHFTHAPHGGWSNTDSVQCTNGECGAGTCLHETKEIAVKLWNRRAYLQTAAADVSGLVERLNAIDEAAMYEAPATTEATIAEAASTLQTLSASIAALEAEIERLRVALKQTEYLMTKDSFSAAERLSEGLAHVRQASRVREGGR